MEATLVRYMGNNVDCFAVVGAFAVSYVALKFLCSLWSGTKTFFLAKALGLSTNLKNLGEWAVVTGATDGIGKGYAFELARQGIKIILVSRSPEKLADVAKEIATKHKVDTKTVAIDFSGGPEIYDKLRKALEGLDIGVLVNNVGMSHEHPMFYNEIKDDKMVQTLINVNINSVAMMTRIVLPAMVEKKKGAIINVSSGSASQPTPLLSLYAGTKAFVEHFSTCLQLEYKSKGVIVQAVLPMFVATKMSRIRRSSLFIPNPTSYARSALATVGVQDRTFGFWSHALQAYLTSFIPKSIAGKLTYMILSQARKAGLKRAQKNQ